MDGLLRHSLTPRRLEGPTGMPARHGLALLHARLRPN